MKNISIHEIQSHFFRNDFDILKISTNFDMQRLRTDVQSVIQNAGFQLKKNRTDYSGIGLQYEDENNPIYDSIDSFTFYPEGGEKKVERPARILVKKNRFGEQLNYIYKTFEPLILFRGRILNAMPNISMLSHTDGRHVYHCHVPVFTNPQCLIHIEDRPYYLEPDGSFYIINAQKPHFVTNKSNEDRIHILFTLNFFSFKNWPKETVDQVINELKLHKGKSRIYAHNGIPE